MRSACWLCVDLNMREMFSSLKDPSTGPMSFWARNTGRTLPWSLTRDDSSIARTTRSFPGDWVNESEVKEKTSPKAASHFNNKIASRRISLTFSESLCSNNVQRC